MNKHLNLVRTFLSAPAEQGANRHLSDMDIVMNQALLMDEGSGVLKAIKAGDMVEILLGLVKLAHCALAAIAQQESDVIVHPVTWRHDGFVLSVMQALSDKIHNCSSGRAEDYSEVYSLCAHLAKSFINADFDKAFQMIHDGKMAKVEKTPDLSECLYE